MGKISYEGEMHIKTLREMGFGCKATVAKFSTNMS